MTARCTLVTGFLGAGKTTLLRHLLARRPPGERWAVIVNDFGAVGLDGAALAQEDTAAGVRIREVAGGCVCCAATVPLRVALTEVLRQLRPDRLLIEPSGLGRPGALLGLLREPGLARALVIGPVLCVVDARGLDPADPIRSSMHADTWREQVEHADVLVINKVDLLDDPARARLPEWTDALYPPPAAVVIAEQGRIDPALLDLRPAAHWRPALLPQPAETPSAIRVAHAPGLGERHEIDAGAIASAGWLIDSNALPAFDIDATQRLLMRLPATLAAGGWQLLRAKGALRTPVGSRLVQWAGGRISIEALASRGDSRFELLAERAGASPAPGAAPPPPPSPPADWSEVEALLRAARAEAD